MSISSQTKDLEMMGEGKGVTHEEIEVAKTQPEPASPEKGNKEEERVTWKAGCCILLLSMTFSVPFWATPTTSAIASQLLGQFGQSELSAWVIPCITIVAAVTILLTGSYSDFFGRRPFLLTANGFTMISYILCATAKNTKMLIAGLSLNGVATGLSAIAIFAVPEMMPNKYRHSGVVLADAWIMVMIVIGPVAGRYVITKGEDTWRWLYWSGLIFAGFVTAGLAVLYFPPKHPRGVSWKAALRGLDYVGSILYAIGCTLILVGVVYTSYLPSKDPRVIACLVVGFITIVAFALWERFSKVKYPLCPNHIFTKNKGREFTIPFCMCFIVTGFYYGTAVIYPTFLNTIRFDENTPVSTQMALTLPANLALPVGSILLMTFGNLIGHWYWTMLISIVSMVLWGGLLALVTPHNSGMMITFVALCQLSFGWASYLAISYTQLGVPQTYLGTSGGLAGTARFTGGAIAAACYSTAIQNGIKNKGAELIPKAVLSHGLPADIIPTAFTAATVGVSALMKIPGMTQQAAEDIVMAYKYSAAFGLRNAALASVAFGVVGIVLALFNTDLTPKMTDKIETFLENDDLADHNRFH